MEGEHGGDARLDKGEAGPRLPPCLQGGSAEDIFDKLADGDPLGLERRVLVYLDQEGWVLPPSRVIQLTGAQLAFEATQYEGRESLDAWIQVCMSKSVGMLVEEQWSDERHGLPVAQCEDAAYYRVFSELIGAELELSRAICCTINSLPDSWRRVFHAVAIQGRTPAELATEVHGDGDLAQVTSLLQAATKEILLVLEASANEDVGADE